MYTWQNIATTTLLLSQASQRAQFPVSLRHSYPPNTLPHANERSRFYYQHDLYIFASAMFSWLGMLLFNNKLWTRNTRWITYPTAHARPPLPSTVHANLSLFLGHLHHFYPPLLLFRLGIPVSHCSTPRLAHRTLYAVKLQMEKRLQDLFVKKASVHSRYYMEIKKSTPVSSKQLNTSR